MKYILAILAILFFTQPVIASKGMFFCGQSRTVSKAPTSSMQKIFKTVNKFFYLVRIAIFIFCMGWLILLLVKAEFEPATPWKKFLHLFVVIVITLFLTIIIKVFAGEKLSSEDTYIDVRRPGITFSKCDRNSSGSTFVPARYIRKKK